jgi:hypothetical protein
MIYKASSKQFRWTLSHGNICSTDAVQRLPSGTYRKSCNVLFLQRLTLLNYRGGNYRSGEWRFHPFAKFVPYRKSCTRTQSQIPRASDAPPRQTSRGFLHWRFAYAGPGARRTTCMGPASANLHNNGSAISVLLSHSERLVACEPVPHLERTSSPPVAYQWRMLLKSGWPRR